MAVMLKVEAKSLVNGLDAAANGTTLASAYIEIIARNKMIRCAMGLHFSYELGLGDVL
jgi:hypothetical protein